MASVVKLTCVQYMSSKFTVLRTELHEPFRVFFSIGWDSASSDDRILIQSLQLQRPTLKLPARQAQHQPRD